MPDINSDDALSKTMRMFLDDASYVRYIMKQNMTKNIKMRLMHSAHFVATKNTHKEEQLKKENSIKVQKEDERYTYINVDDNPHLNKYKPRFNTIKKRIPSCHIRQIEPYVKALPRPSGIPMCVMTSPTLECNLESRKSLIRPKTANALPKKKLEIEKNVTQTKEKNKQVKQGGEQDKD